VASQRLDSLGARALHLAAYTLTMSGCPDEALVVYDRALSAAYARGDNIWASGCSLFRAYTQLRRGDLAAVESDLGRYAELMEYETAHLYSGAFQAELARERGLTYIWPDQPRPMTALDAFGAGCAAFDCDNDDWQDVLLVADPHPRLFRNTGAAHFEDVSAGSGLTSVDGDWTGCAIGDYNSDGLLDVLLTGYHQMALFENLGARVPGALVDVVNRVIEEAVKSVKSLNR
jgi:hypothetical protein